MSAQFYRPEKTVTGPAYSRWFKFLASLVAFVLASIVARAMRFYLVAGLLYWFGEPVREFIEKRLSLVTTAFVILLVGGFVAISFLF